MSTSTDRRGLRSWIVIWFASLVFATAGLASTASQSLQRAFDAARQARLTGDATRVEQVTLNLGLAKLSIVSARLYPATPIAGRPREFVLIGHAILGVEPSDDVEKHQLEIFTGRPALIASLDEAVLVLGHDNSIDALMNKPTANNDPSELERAEELFREWHESHERRTLHVDTAIARGVIDDPGSQSHFVGWFNSPEHGRFTYVVDPWRKEQIELGQFVQVELGQFVQVELDRLERKTFHRFLDKLRRRCGLRQFEPEDPSVWRSWVRASQRRGGHPAPGSSGYEPRNYKLELTMDPKKGLIRGTATLTLVADALAGRAVSLTTMPAIRIDGARAYGRPLLVSTLPATSTIHLAEKGTEARPLQVSTPTGSPVVFLDKRPRPGDEVVLEIDFSGLALHRPTTDTFMLSDAAYWYPHAGDVDLATYDVTLSWPKRLEVLAPGRLIESHTRDGRQVKRWVIDRPTFATTFEIGHYGVYSRQVGDVSVKVAIDRLSRRVLADEEVMLNAIARPLRYLTSTFGPLPTDEITLVTSTRDHSRSFRGFVTLSTLMLRNDLFVGPGQEDPRTLIAHELAHQWWGHRMGVLSDRDLWLSESLADYSAELFARDELSDLDDRRSPTDGWQADVTRPIDGLEIGGLGPVTLGPRLATNHSDLVYQTIIYKKGALIAQMLATLSGHGEFNSFLGRLARELDYRPIDTEQFLEALEQTTGLDLAGFARDYVYGTHHPVFEVDYRVEENAESGGYTIRGAIERLPSVELVYRLAEEEHGLTVARSYRVETGPEWTDLAVPFEIVVTSEPKEDSEDRGKLLGGVLLLEGNVQTFELDVLTRPTRFSVDPNRTIFATFYHREQDRSEIDKLRSLLDLARGNVDQAKDQLSESLDRMEDSGVGRDESIPERVHRAECLLGLAHLELESDETRVARSYLEQAKRSVEGRSLEQPALRDLTASLEARLLLREGQAKKALRLLRGRDLANLGTESLLVLAIAAKQLGELELYERAIGSTKLERARVESLDLLTGRP